MGFGNPPDFRKLWESDDLMIIALPAGFPHEGGGGEELREVLVRSDHEGLEIIGLSPLDQGSDDVVRLEAVDFQNRNVEGAAQVFHVGNRGGEFLGHLVTLCLVGRVFDVTRSGCGGVEGDADVRRVFLFEDEQQRVDESVERGGVGALGVADRVLDEREVGAIHQGHAVEEEKAFHDRSLDGHFRRVQKSAFSAACPRMARSA